MSNVKLKMPEESEVEVNKFVRSKARRNVSLELSTKSIGSDPSFMSGIYADNEASIFDYPVGSTVANNVQFSTLETMFNQFYEWYVPNRVVNKSIKLKKVKKEAKDPIIEDKIE